MRTIGTLCFGLALVILIVTLLLFKQGRIDEADVAIRRSLEIDSGHASAHYNLGNVLLEGRHDNQAALNEYRTASQLDPNMYEPYYNAAMILMQQQDFAAAEQAFRTSLDLHPGNARGHANRGISLVAWRKAGAASTCRNCRRSGDGWRH